MKCWLWRAVDQDGYVLDEIAQKRRNTKGGQTFADPALEETRPFTQADNNR